MAGRGWDSFERMVGREVKRGLKKALAPLSAESLIKASRTGDENGVKDVLNGYPNLLNFQDKDGSTPLLHACAKGHKKVVRELLSREGVDCNIRNHRGDTALMKAAQAGREDIVTMLLRKGAKTSEKNQDGWTALIYASGSHLSPHASALSPTNRPTPWKQHLG
jgi:ankyrin repeat protein